MLRIGTPRLVPGPTLPVLYPGEQATARSRLTTDGRTVQVVDWLVEPMPGWRGLYLRWAYRLVWCWVPGGHPKIEAAAKLDASEPGVDTDQRVT